MIIYLHKIRITANEDPYVGYCNQEIIYGIDGLAIMSRYLIITYIQISHAPLNNDTSYDITHDFFDVKVNANGTLMHIIASHLKALTGSQNE